MKIHNIIFDWKRTLYDPDAKSLTKGALDLLKSIKHHNIPMILIGKGDSHMHDEVERLDVKSYFTDVIFREGEKDIGLFSQFICSSTPKETVFIGDRVRSELAAGNTLGATTIWVKQGKFAIEEPINDAQKPNFIAQSLSEVMNIIRE